MSLPRYIVKVSQKMVSTDSQALWLEQALSESDIDCPASLGHFCLTVRTRKWNPLRLTLLYIMKVTLILLNTPRG